MKKASLILLILITVCTFFNWTELVLNLSMAKSNQIAIVWLYHYPLIPLVLILGYVVVFVRFEIKIQKFLMFLVFLFLFLLLLYLPIQMFNWEIISTKEYFYAVLTKALQPAYYLATILSLTGTILGFINLLKKGETTNEISN
ncbi:TPA: hypothetical protein MPW97_000424 [Listeria monocytogenes]|uniref:hypothetical protein n=1 Tax=Listeria monocytogenes TaxID=1639 RepID=UPI00070F4D34|nr:hypothetical protein [Listeria monocytogenes]EHC5239724.1 hypothetical protein [Listeria monocytogenes serotype 1/2a]EAC2205812.1 hypothetical protein [Listeria monocytogenes]EAC2904346.1 hypothetical protein [Listeria monocytogenes]EAC3783199.1 hypothetical protein [Listeria monocytogenes]EAC5127119.1 hypothetical protein [Listeria monocytogenes]